MSLDSLRKAVAQAEALTAALEEVHTKGPELAEAILAQAEDTTEATARSLRKLLAQEEGAALERVRQFS